jgi:hypothetical protein
MRGFYVRGIGMQAPGMQGWSACCGVLSGRVPYSDQALVPPMPEILPSNERRRATASVRLALSAAQEAAAASGVDVSAFATVFTSSDGDGITLDQICDTLARAPLDLSPTRFHNSVHNAPAGYWSIATQSRHASTSLCAFDASFAAGLMEAAAQVAAGPAPVLLVAFDLPFPPVLNPLRPVFVPVAVALALSADPGSAPMARCELALEPSAATAFAGRGGLDALYANPAGRALPLLALLAQRAPGTVRLEYLDSCSIAVQAQPF